MTLEEIVTVGVETAGPSTSVEVLAATMADDGIGSIVIEDDREPVGIVTDRDLTVRVLGAGLDPEATTAAQVMTADPATVHIDDGVADLTATMCAASVRRMPVVDDAGEIVGIVTLDDAVRLLVGELGELADVIEGESPAY